MIKLPRMSPSQRLYFGLMALVGLLVLALVGGAYGANNLLTARANTLTNLKAKDLALSQEQASLITAKKDLRTYASLETITQSVVPEDKDQAQTVRQIVDIAAANGVNLGTIDFPSSTLGTSTTGAVGSATTTSPVATTPVNPNSSTVRLSQLVAVKNIPGVYDLLINIQTDPNKPVTYNNLISFLGALEHNRRTAQISSISLQPKSDNPSLLNFSLTLNEYIKP